MFGYANSKSRTLILASVLTLTGGYAMAQPQGGGGDSEGPPPKQMADGQGQGKMQQRHGEHGEAGERGPRGQRDPEAMAKRLFAGMELTDDQKTQIREIMKTHGDERRAWHEEHKEALQALREKMRDAREADDKDAMQAVRDEVHALMDTAPKPDATHDQIRALLNEDQQKTFDERIAKMRERMDQRRERGEDGPPPPGMGPGPDGPPPMDGDGPPPDGRRAGARLFGNLDLTDDQRASLREIMQSDQTREEKMTAVRELLNDEQKAKLDENIEKMKKFREEHQGDRPRPRDGEGPRGDRPGRGGDQAGDEMLDL